MANLSFLIMMGIITISAAQNHRAWKARMAKFAMRTLATRHRHKTRLCEV